MCIETLQQERDEALAELRKITVALRGATHKKAERDEEKYQECLELIVQLERDIKMVQLLEAV